MQVPAALMLTILAVGLLVTLQHNIPEDQNCQNPVITCLTSGLLVR